MKAKPSQNQFLLVLTTVGSPQEAKKLSQQLLRKRLAACVNLIPRMDSWYWWKGRIERSKETLLLIKTSQTCLKNLQKLLKTLHSYDLPELIALPIRWGSQPYLDWLKESLRKPL